MFVNELCTAILEHLECLALVDRVAPIVDPDRREAKQNEKCLQTKTKKTALLFGFESLVRFSFGGFGHRDSIGQNYANS